MNSTNRTINGDLVDLPVPKLLCFLFQSQKTGVLTLSRVSKNVNISMKEGRPVFVDSDYFSGLTLGDFLVAKGLISREDCDRTWAEIQEGGKRHGEYLVEKQLVAPHELAEILGLQMKAKIFKVFQWTQGSYSFQESPLSEDVSQFVPMNLPHIIYDGVRDHLVMEKLPREFRGRKESVLHRRSNPLIDISEIRMRAQEVRMYKLIDGTKTMRQLVVLSKMKKKTAYMVLYALLLLGLIGFPESVVQKPSPEERRKAPRPAPKPSEPAEQGYELNVNEDIIQQALASVDRIRREVKEDQVTETIGSEDLTVEIGDLSAQEPGEVFAEEPEAEPIEEMALPPDVAFEEPETVAGPDLSSESEDLPEPSVGEQEPSLSMEEEPIESAREPSPEMEVIKQEDMNLSEGDYQPKEGEFDQEGDEFRMYAEGEEPPPPPSSSSEDLTAEEALRQGQYFLDHGRFEEAREMLRRAVESNPDDTGIHPFLGWAIYNAGRGIPQAFHEAEEIIKKAIDADPNNYLAYLYLGKIYKLENQLDFAELHFVRAMQLNIDCTEAKEEMKALYRR